MVAKSAHPAFLELARNLGAADGHRIHLGPSVVWLEPHLGSKGSLLGAYFHASARIAIAPYEILVRHERALDRAGKDLGINREVQTGDPVFDREVYIETDGRDEHVKRIFADPSVRETIRAIVTSKVEALTLGGAEIATGAEVPDAYRLRVRVVTSVFEETEALRRVLANLAALARDMDRAALGGPYRDGPARAGVAPPAKDRIGRGLLLFAWCAVANVMGWFGVGFGDSPPTFGWRAFGVGVGLGLMVWIALVVVSAALLRGRSTSLRNVIAFAVFSVATVLVGGRVGEVLNATLDRSTPHAESATTKREPRKKKGDRCVVTLDATNAGAEVRGAWRDAVRFSSQPLPVEVIVGDGAFGSPHVLSLHEKQTR